MMKTFLRTFVFTYISVYFLLLWVPFYRFDDAKTCVLFVVMFSLLYYMDRHILNIVSLPDEGIQYLFINIVLTYVMLLVFSVFFDSFTINPIINYDLNLGLFVVTSFNLGMPWSGMVSAVLMCLIYGIFNWLTYKKR